MQSLQQQRVPRTYHPSRLFNIFPIQNPETSSTPSLLHPVSITLPATNVSFRPVFSSSSHSLPPRDTRQMNNLTGQKAEARAESARVSRGWKTRVFTRVTCPSLFRLLCEKHRVDPPLCPRGRRRARDTFQPPRLFPR